MCRSHLRIFSNINVAFISSGIQKIFSNPISLPLKIGFSQSSIRRVSIDTQIRWTIPHHSRKNFDFQYKYFIRFYFVVRFFYNLISIVCSDVRHRRCHRSMHKMWHEDSAANACNHRSQANGSINGDNQRMAQPRLHCKSVANAWICIDIVIEEEGNEFGCIVWAYRHLRMQRVRCRCVQWLSIHRNVATASFRAVAGRTKATLIVRSRACNFQPEKRETRNLLSVSADFRSISMHIYIIALC